MYKYKKTKKQNRLVKLQNYYMPSEYSAHRGASGVTKLRFGSVGAAAQWQLAVAADVADPMPSREDRQEVHWIPKDDTNEQMQKKQLAKLHDDTQKATPSQTHLTTHGVPNSYKSKFQTYLQC